MRKIDTEYYDERGFNLSAIMRDAHKRTRTYNGLPLSDALYFMWNIAKRDAVYFKVAQAGEVA